MGKRIAIILSVLLISGLAILTYYFIQGRKSFFSDPWKSVASDASIVIESLDIQSFMNSLTTGKGLFGEIPAIKGLEEFNVRLKYIADQLNKPSIKKILGDGPVILSFHNDKTNTLRPLFSKALYGKIKVKQVKDALRTSGVDDTKATIDGAASLLGVPFKYGSHSDTVYFSIVSGLILCSTSEEVIIKAKEQTSQENDVRSMPGFSRVLMASGKNEDKIFVIFSNLSAVLKSMTREKGSDNAENGRDHSLPVGTAGADIFINDDGLVLSGYTESTDSKDLLYRYKTVTPATFLTYRILPSSTALFETLIPPLALPVIQKDTSINQRTIDLALQLRQYMGDEITRAIIEIRERPVADNTLIIYKLNNRDQAEKAFLESLPEGNEILWFEPDDQVKIPVYRCSLPGLKKLFVSGFSSTTNETFFTFYDNFLITGSSYVTVSRILYDNLLNKTLANDLSYRDFESSLPSRSGYFFYCVPSRITDYLEDFLNADIISAFRENKNSLNKISAAGYQLASSNGMIYNSMSIRFKDKAREESTTEWETLLDTVAAIKPFFFTNHTTGAKEIFIQDLKNNIYLINIAGRVLWKVPLNERIGGSVFMIDYFNNGKYQLLFSGRNFLHLLDRNGNYVERYPVKLRSPASNTLAMFDYDNNQTYRLFIAGDDKLIYSYDKTGSVVKGWKPFRTSGVVKNEVSYFKVSGKDYIVASDESSVYMLDRTGNRRVTFREAVVKAKNSAMRLVTGSDPYIVCTAPDGTIQQLRFDGNVSKFSLGRFSGEHSFDIFDVDGDGFGEYIFIDKGILYLYDHNKAEMFTRDFGPDDLGGPLNFVFSGSERKIGVFDITKKQIYLIGNSGETMNGFPLRGASMFSIGKLSEKSGWHLIVGGTDRFLYNYKIDNDIK